MIDYKKRKYADEQGPREELERAEKINKILRTEPENRVQSCGNKVEDKINGILLGAIKIAESRGGHIDFITLKYAKEEIKELIKECGGSVD